MKVEGSTRPVSGTSAPWLLAALFLAAPALASGAALAASPVEDIIIVLSGEFYKEEIFPPTDGSPWHLTATLLNGTGPIDLYIMPTTELIAAYPTGSFAPVIAKENVTSANFDFSAPSRLQSFVLIVDNLDNPRPTDAHPRGEARVMLVRPPPLRSSPEAQALLSSGASICAAVLAAATVAVAVYLKRRPRPDTDEAQAARAPRIEVAVEVPKPPPGAWARGEPPEAAPPEEKG